MQVQNVKSSQITSVQSKKTASKRSDKSSHVPNAENKVKAAAIAGSAVGIIATVAMILSKSKKLDPKITLASLKYHEKQVIGMGAASVTGGLIGGLLADKTKNNKAKIRESIQQFGGNILIPVSLLAMNTKLLDKSGFTIPVKESASKLRNIFNGALKGLPLVVVTVASLVGGMKIGNVIFNKINNKIFKDNEKREQKASDYSAHIDDLCMTASLLPIGEVVNKVTTKLLPFTFLIAGYEAGTSEAKEA